MGTLLIIFSSLYLLTSLFGAVTTFLGDTFTGLISTVIGASPEIKKSGIDFAGLFAELKPVYRIQGLEKLATAAISGFGLFAGIKLVQYRLEGIKLSLQWALAALGYLIVEIAVYIVYINPIATRFVTKLTAQLKPILPKDELGSLDAITSMVGTMGLGSTLAFAVVMAVFPILMLAMLQSDRVKSACATINE